MKSIRLKLTVEQIKGVLRISQTQLFHVKYLDPRIPGYKAEPGALENAESAVRVLEAALKEDRLNTPIVWATPSRNSPVKRVM